jgi:preprotein translocase subunit YajC
MPLAILNGFLAFAPTPAPGTQTDPKAQMLQMVGTLVFMAIAMYLIMFRPQQKKARQHADLLKTIKAGDKIVTSGGILGVVVGIKDKSISIRSADTKLEVLKTAISEVLEKSSSTSES